MKMSRHVERGGGSACCVAGAAEPGKAEPTCYPNYTAAVVAGCIGGGVGLCLLLCACRALCKWC